MLTRQVGVLKEREKEKGGAEGRYYILLFTSHVAWCRQRKEGKKVRKKGRKKKSGQVVKSVIEMSVYPKRVVVHSRDHAHVVLILSRIAHTSPRPSKFHGSSLPLSFILKTTQTQAAAATAWGSSPISSIEP